MDWKLTLSDVQLSEEEIQASLEALRSNWLTMGPRTQDLERRFAERVGRAHGVAVSSGSAGLHLACIAAGVGPGDEVIVPSLSFVADGHAPHWCGAEAVMADVVSADEPLLDVEHVRSLITPRTKAVIAVHMFGYPMELAALRELCDEHDLVLIEDTCEVMDATLEDGSLAGLHGQTAVFSFFAKSQMPVGEGGIVVTDDPEVEAKVRLLRSHAMTSVTWDRHRGHAETYDIVDLGYNYRLDEPRAAMANAHLDGVGARIEALRRHAAGYRERLADIAGIEVPFDAAWSDRASHFSFPVLVADLEIRDRIRRELMAQRIQTTAYPALTQLSIFAEAAERSPCPKAAEVADRHVVLPLYAGLSGDDLDLVVEALATVLDG